MDIKSVERFRDFVYKIDNIGQVITAQDINALYDVVEALQGEAFRQRDEDFLRMLVDTLEHNPDLNAMWVELLSTDEMVDMNNSLGIRYSAEELSVCLADGFDAGFFTSKRYTPKSNCNVKKVMLFAEYTAGENDELIFEVSNNGLDYMAVEPNTGSVVTLKTDGSSIYVRVRMRRGADSEGPRIGAWAVLYFDQTLHVDLDQRAELDIDYEDLNLPPPPAPPQIKPQLYHNELLGIGPDDHHPKIHKHSGEPGENDKIDLTQEVKNILPWANLPPQLEIPNGYIKIIRDPENEDRVSKIEGPNFNTYLTYNGEKLAEVFTEYIRDENIVATVKATLDWQQYTFADGTTDEVVVGVNIERTEVYS